MAEICPKCGLPKDLCICETISKEEQRIKIRLEKRKYGRDMTIVEGIDPKSFNLREVVTTLKTKLACGGTVKNGVIMLQGDHREKVKAILMDMGFPEEQIEIR